MRRIELNLLIPQGKTLDVLFENDIRVLTFDIPANVKLIRMQALLDYAPDIVKMIKKFKIDPNKKYRIVIEEM